jgi:hypothetical protein
MKSYEVNIQEKFYKTITAANIQEVLSQISEDIKQNLVPEFDSTKPQNIRVVPSVESNS